MSTKYKFYNPDGTYFVSFSVVRWIDVFTRNLYREIFLDSLKYCQSEKGLVIHAYVIMTNHRIDRMMKAQVYNAQDLRQG